jgi:hypothetical protein
LAVSISLVLLLGVAVFIAWRYTGLRAWHALLCIAFGFCLSQTGAAPELQHLISSLANILSSGKH